MHFCGFISYFIEAAVKVILLGGRGGGEGGKILNVFVRVFDSQCGKGLDKNTRKWKGRHLSFSLTSAVYDTFFSLPKPALLMLALLKCTHSTITNTPRLQTKFDPQTFYSGCERWFGLPIPSCVY